MAVFGTSRAVSFRFPAAPTWMGVYQLACPGCCATRNLEVHAEHHRLGDLQDRAWGYCTSPDHGGDDESRRFHNPLIYPVWIRSLVAWDAAGRPDGVLPVEVQEWLPHKKSGTYIDDFESPIDVELSYHPFTVWDWKWLHVNWPGPKPLGSADPEVQRLRDAFERLTTQQGSDADQASVFPLPEPPISDTA